MRFVCDSCRAQYMISDDKVGAKGVKVRCKKCGYVILVRPGGASASKDEGTLEAPTATASAASNGAASTTAAGLPVSLGTPPEGGLFTDVEEDEIGAVFDQVLNSGSQKIPAAEPQGDDARESKASAAAVRKLAEAEAEPDEPQAAPPAHDWYVAIDEKQVGPLSVEKVKDYWDRGEVGPDSLCWRQGFGDWIPLSEATELASALAPRPAKPVIVAPAAVGASASSAPAPVESAFSAGAAAKSTRAEIPSAPAMGPEPTSSGWKPSAASVLASLVKEENEALSKPPPKPTKADEKPAAGGGLLDLPPPEPAVAPAPRASPVLAAAAAEPALQAPQPTAMPYSPPAPAPAYAQPGPAYPQPAYAPAGYPQPAYQGYPPPAAPAPRGGNKMGMMIGIGVAVVALLVVVLVMVLKPSSPQPAESPPVAVQQPPAAATKPPEQPAAATPPAAAANPAVAAASPSAPTPAPAATPPSTPPAVAAVTPPPAATPPPPAAVEPAAVKPAEPARTEPAVARVEKTEPARSTTKPRPSSSDSVATPSKSRPSQEASDDEFDELFGSKKSESKKPTQTSQNTPSTYVPPEPGGAARERLGQSDIMEVVLANRPAIVKCVNEQKKKDPGMSGKLVMRWTIQTSGKTTGVSVRSEEFKKTYLATCISGLIRNWTFPKHRKQGDPIDFPFTF